MIDIVLPQIVTALITAIVASSVTGVVCFAKGKAKAHAEAKAESDAIQAAEREVLKTLARKEIIDFHAQYVIGDSRMTVERYEEIHRLFEAYKTLGGNGTAKKLMEEITAKRPYIVVD